MATGTEGGGVTFLGRNVSQSKSRSKSRSKSPHLDIVTGVLGEGNVVRVEIDGDRLVEVPLVDKDLKVEAAHPLVRLLKLFVCEPVGVQLGTPWGGGVDRGC